MMKFGKHMDRGWIKAGWEGFVVAVAIVDETMTVHAIVVGGDKVANWM